MLECIHMGASTIHSYTCINTPNNTSSQTKRIGVSRDCNFLPLINYPPY